MGGSHVGCSDSHWFDGVVSVEAFRNVNFNTGNLRNVNSETWEQLELDI
jgi:hypothetical protein